MIPALAHVIKSLLVGKNGSSSKPGVEAYIACTNRKPESIALFLKNLQLKDLKTEVVFKRAFSPADCNMVSHEPLQPVTLFRIYLGP